MAPSKDRGFSLLELMITIAIACIVMAFSVMALMPMYNKDHVDTAYETTLEVLRNYRNLSITQSKRYVIFFTPPTTITVQYWGAGSPAPAPVTVATYNIPNDVQYGVQAGFPNPGPDGFGTGAAAITLTYSCVLVGQPCLIFYPDGSAQDDIGDFNNGVIYITRPGNMYNSRAVTVFGTTGRIRGWRLDQVSSNWIQQ